ncbi:hypothetical protein [Emcibacter sp. SYSU 3D8]|uniref:hypothetical protein n=1 Tax=Emcibacter sp. SYSU 3D8 TaxID=3133969 RepID=UPI0031FEDB1E
MTGAAGADPRQEIETHGYYVARGVLTAAEIDRLRTVAVEQMHPLAHVQRLGYIVKGAVAAMPDLAWLLRHPALLDSARQLLGDGPLVLCDCDCQLDVVGRWHRDDHDHRGSFFKGDHHARDECRIYRAALYLQDHADNDWGLKVRRGSHRQRQDDGLPVDDLRTRAGDIIFFDCRTNHIGIVPDPVERMLVGLGRRLQWPGWILGLKKAWWRLTGKPAKAAIFFAFGTPHPDTEDFCRAEITFRRMRWGHEKFRIDEDVAHAFDAAGVLTFDAALKRRFGPAVLDDMAAGKPLPEERLWT